jgi:hypothetical protein
MKHRRRTFSTSNLLAYLEATALGLVEVSENERLQALEAAQGVARAESQKWRVHRRPSAGRSRPLRRKVLSVAVFLALLHLRTPSFIDAVAACSAGTACTAPRRSAGVPRSNASGASVLEQIRTAALKAPFLVKPKQDSY